MNILLDAMPDFLMVNDQKIMIDSGFRTWIRFDEALFWNSDPMEQRIYAAMQVCYDGEIPADINSAVRAAIAFYAQTDQPFEDPQSDEPNDQSLPERNNRTYSFTHDASLICAAFLSQYGIDLTKDDLHWWHFKALFEGLDGESKLCKIMEIRAMDLSKVKDNESKAHYRRLKRLYRLPDPRSEDEQEADMLDAFSAMF